MHTSIRSHPPRPTPRTFWVPYGKLGLKARTAGRRHVRRVYAEASMPRYRMRNEPSRTTCELGRSCCLLTTGTSRRLDKAERAQRGSYSARSSQAIVIVTSTHSSTPRAVTGPMALTGRVRLCWHSSQLTIPMNDPRFCGESFFSRTRPC